MDYNGKDKLNRGIQMFCRAAIYYVPLPLDYSVADRSRYRLSSQTRTANLQSGWDLR